jgi:hypothetical protein
LGREVRALGWAHVVAIAVAFSALIFSVGKYNTGRTHSQDAASPARDTISESSSDAKLASRPNYPYSVIPGGVGNAAELQRDLAKDPIAAAHYSNFDAARAHVVRLDRDRLAYVSYRMGDRVFWTRKQIRLPKGETIITDGSHEARTRCGNRISDVPVDPVSNLEPIEQAFDSPETLDIVAVNSPSPVSLMPSSQPLFPPPATGAPSGSPPGGGGGGGEFIPPPYYPPVGGRTTPLTPGPPPVNVPEPGSLELLALGGGLLLIANWFVEFRRSRRI